MTPVEAVTKAIIRNVQLRDFGHDEIVDGEPGFTTTADKIEALEECCRFAARAALLALAEAQIQDAVADQGWSDFMARDEERIDPSPSKDMKAAFRAMLRALAKEESQ